MVARDLARPHRHQRELRDPQLERQRHQLRPLVALQVQLGAALGAQRAQHAHVVGSRVAVVTSPVQGEAVGTVIEAGLPGDHGPWVGGAPRVAQQRDLVEVDRKLHRHDLAYHEPRAGVQA